VQYPHDGGVSAIRFYLADANHLASVAAAAIDVGAYEAGELVCQCGLRDAWSLARTDRCSLLVCSCNGSSLPLYIGPPPNVAGLTSIACASCGEGRGAAAIAIGYRGAVPPLGSLDAERAQQIAVAMRCSRCKTEWLAWQLRLAEPYPVRGDEDWLRAIQGRFR
jgi:hypothetical protein